MCPRAGLDAVAKRKNLFTYRGSNTGRPTHNIVSILTELSRYYRNQIKEDEPEGT